MQRILITGPLGQDGKIITEKLRNYYDLFGVCRIKTPLQVFNDHQKKFGINLVMSDLSDLNSVDCLIQNVNPDVIINFAGETDVLTPWGDINKTFEQNVTIPLNLLNSIVKLNRDIFFFQASSSLMYARSQDLIINEKSNFSPLFPYGISKLTAHNFVNEYREKFSLKACSGIFFNHESFHRSEKFLSKKLSKLVSSIIQGRPYKISLYDLNYYRDVSHAEDFMAGVKLIVDSRINDDFVFSSGESTHVLEFCKRFFTLHNLEFEDYVDYTDSDTYEHQYKIIGDNSKLKSLNWLPKHNTDSLILEMVNKELNFRK